MIIITHNQVLTIVKDTDNRVSCERVSKRCYRYEFHKACHRKTVKPSNYCEFLVKCDLNLHEGQQEMRGNLRESAA